MSQSPNPSFVPESWSLYGVGVFFGVVRLASKARRVGIRHMQLDDGFIAFGLVAYTMLCISFNEMATGAGSNLMTPEEVASLTPAIVAQRVRGSKWVFVSEHAMLLTIWSMKAAMLILFARVTEGLRVRKLLNGVIVWVICAFLGDELALFTICRPLSQYWAVPVDNPQCATYQYFEIINAVFNISTDIMILAIGVPPVLSARLSLQKKIVLGIIFGMGIFVIVAATLRAIYCLVPSLISYVYMNWYFREASVAVYVTTLPGIWVFLREVFPLLGSMGTTKNHSKPSTDSNKHHPESKSSRPRDSNYIDLSRDYDHDLDTYPISKSMAVSSNRELERGPTSDDGDQGDTSSLGSQRSDFMKNGIRRDVTFTVESIPVAKV